MTIHGKFSGGVAWMAFGNWFEQGINFAVFVLLARLLGAESFGLLALAAAFVLLCEFLVRETLSEFLISFAEPQDAHYNTVFWMLVLLGAVLCLLLVAVAVPVAAMLGEPRVAGLIRALSPTVLMIALTAVPVAILRRELRFATLSLRAIAGVMVGGVVGVTMALNGYGVWSLAGQRLAQVLTNIIMAWAVVSWRPKFAFSVPHGREVLRFGGAVLGLRAGELAATQVPAILIGAMHGPAVLGLFSIAWRLVETGSFLIVTPLRMAAQPAFAALTRSGENAAELLVSISKLSGLVAIAAFAGLASLAGPIIEMVFGPQWADAAAPLKVLSVYGAYLCIEKINQAFCLAAGRARATALIAWAEVCLGALLVWLAAPWGLWAMSAGLVASVLVFWPMRFRVVAGIAEVSPLDLAQIYVAPVIAAAVMAFAVFITMGLVGGRSPQFEVFAGTIVGLATLSAIVWFTMRARVDLLKEFVKSPTQKGQNQP